MNKLFPHFAIFFACITGLQAQNLVPNYSFEEATGVEVDDGFVNVVDWKWFLTCDYHKQGFGGTLPDNIDYWGYQEPFSGEAMAGIRTFYTEEPEWHEFISAKLIHPLDSGGTYFISFQVSPSEAGKFVSDDIGLRVSNVPPPPYIKFQYISLIYGFYYELTPQIFNREGNFLNNTGIWYEISGYYTASEGDEYIIIGNFKNDDSTTYVNQNIGKIRTSYYFIDEVVVRGCVNYPKVDLGPDTVVCEGSQMTLDAYWPGATYAWNTGETSSSIEVTQPGKYMVRIYNNGCVQMDSILVNHLPLNSLGSDIFLCDESELGFSLDATVPVPGTKYLWNDDQDSPVKTIDAPGVYWVDVSAGACSLRDTVNVSMFSSDMLVFPNPNDGQFTLSFNRPFKGELNIFDILGRKVFTHQGIIPGNLYPIDLEGLSPSGIFFMEAKMEGCSRAVKFVVAH